MYIKVVARLRTSSADVFECHLVDGKHLYAELIDFKNISVAELKKTGILSLSFTDVETFINSKEGFKFYNETPNVPSQCNFDCDACDGCKVDIR